MIQSIIFNDTPGSPSFRTADAFVNVAPYFSVTPTIGSADIGGTIYYFITYPYFLFKLESQETGKTKFFCREGVSIATGVGSDKHERYINFQYFYSVSSTMVEDLSAAKLRVGTTDFPLGFYNYTIYETLTDGELNPDNATATLYSGTLNMKGSDSDNANLNFESVKYDKYTNNDADTESVYITF